MQLFSQIDRAAPSLFASRHDGHGTDSEREWNGSCKINNGFSPIRMASPEERNMRIESFSRRIAKNLLWNITGQGWLLLLTFLATPFLIRRLGVELYGIYILVAILVDYCSFAQFGIVDASVKYVTERRAREEQRGVQETFWTAMLSQAVIGFAGAMTILSLTDLLVGHVFRVPEGLVREARFAITMGAMSFSLSMVTSVTTGALRAVGRFDLINIAGILWGTLQTGAAVALLWLGQSLSAILFSNLCVQLLSLVMLGTFARRLLPVTMPPAWSTAEMKRLLRLGGFLTVSGVAGPILTNIEKMILSAIHTVSALTYYHVPFSLINRLAVIPSSFSSVLFPAYSYFQGKQDMEANRSPPAQHALSPVSVRRTAAVLYLFRPHISRVVGGLRFRRGFDSHPDDPLRGGARECPCVPVHHPAQRYGKAAHPRRISRDRNPHLHSRLLLPHPDARSDGRRLCMVLQGFSRHAAASRCIVPLPGAVLAEMVP